LRERINLLEIIALVQLLPLRAPQIKRHELLQLTRVRVERPMPRDHKLGLSLLPRGRILSGHRQRIYLNFAGRLLLSPLTDGALFLGRRADCLHNTGCYFELGHDCLLIEVL